MADRPVQSYSLREMLVEAERLSRELSEHLDQSFLPKCLELTRLVRPINGEPPDERALEDVTLRTQAARVLDTDTFTEKVFEQLLEYCKAIEGSVNKIATEG
ncbi:MAG TPA: hypothetical protein VGP63_20450 [Planctomycetaceae bacterium]|nr:hypothetical protein [Planctomycetaceae bacterium]